MMNEVSIFSNPAVWCLVVFYVLTVGIAMAMVVRGSLNLTRALWLGWLLAAGANVFLAWGVPGLSLAFLVLLLTPAVLWAFFNAVIYLSSKGGRWRVDLSIACGDYRISTVYRDCLALLVPIDFEEHS